MNKAKALKLAEFLETKVKPSWFSMNSWATEGFKEKKCGSVACAIGWATVAFPRSSLFLTGLSGSSEYQIAYKDREGSVFYKNDAIDKFFNLNPNEGDFSFIFSPLSWEKLPTPKQVAKRIRQYIENPKKVEELAISRQLLRAGRNKHV